MLFSVIIQRAFSSLVGRERHCMHTYSYNMHPKHSAATHVHVCTLIQRISPNTSISLITSGAVALMRALSRMCYCGRTGQKNSCTRYALMNITRKNALIARESRGNNSLLPRVATPAHSDVERGHMINCMNASEEHSVCSKDWMQFSATRVPCY